MKKYKPAENSFLGNYLNIEMDYTNTKFYLNGKTFDEKALTQSFVWHQVEVHHKSGTNDKETVLEALHAAVGNEKFFPIYYKCDAKKDTFLVRDCIKAIRKLFEKGLNIRLKNKRKISIGINLNVGHFRSGQINPSSCITLALKNAFKIMLQNKKGNRILDLTNLKNRTEFSDIEINLGNAGVFSQICYIIYNNDKELRHAEGIDFRNNNISNLEAMKTFKNYQFRDLDFRNNNISSSSTICENLKDIKADNLYLHGNPITEQIVYPKCLEPIYTNFKNIDKVSVDKLNSDDPLLNGDYDIHVGYRIDLQNKDEMDKYIESNSWHAIVIPDYTHKIDKEQLFEFFFVTVSSECTPIFPCYYRFIEGMHQFLVRNCFDQLMHLLNEHELEIKFPRLYINTDEFQDSDNESTLPAMDFGLILKYSFSMNVTTYSNNQIDPMRCIEQALNQRFNSIDRTLNLNNFQNTDNLNNIIINLSTPSILIKVLQYVSRKYFSLCIELRLCQNKISGIFGTKCLSKMTYLKSIDLGDNLIYSLNNIQVLEELGLKTLRLDGNPLCSEYQIRSDYLKAVRRSYPQLIRLDHVDINQLTYLRSQSNYLCNIKGYDFINEFIQHYFNIFDSKNREILKDLYHPKAMFSIICNCVTSKASVVTFKHIAKYMLFDRNFFKQTKKNRISKIYCGPVQIIKVLQKLPFTKHDFINFKTETTMYNEKMFIVTVHGLFKNQTSSSSDFDMSLAFTRTFTLMPVKYNLGMLQCKTSYQIMNDQFNIYYPTQEQNKNSFKYNKKVDESYTTTVSLADKQALILIFQEITYIRTVWCIKCLEDAEWNLLKALELFKEYYYSKQIPDIP